jgi:hypothetical protein
MLEKIETGVQAREKGSKLLDLNLANLKYDCP